jgi:hypothetical protein
MLSFQKVTPRTDGTVQQTLVTYFSISCSFLLNCRLNDNKNWRNFATPSDISNECDIDRQSNRAIVRFFCGWRQIAYHATALTVLQSPNPTRASHTWASEGEQCPVQELVR